MSKSARVFSLLAVALLFLGLAWMLGGERQSPSPGAAGAPNQSFDGQETELEEPELRAPDQPRTDTAAEEAEQDPAALAADWLRRINATKNRAELDAVLQALGALDGEALVALLRRVFPQVKNLKRRLAILDSFGSVAGDRSPHAKAVAILDLGIGDPLLRVSSHAMDLIMILSRLGFTDGAEGYDRWNKESEGKPAEQVIRESAISLMERLRGRKGTALEQALAQEGLLRRWDVRRMETLGVDHVRVLREIGARELAHAWWSDDRNSPVVREAGMRLVGVLGPDESYLREHVVPVLEQPMHHDNEVIRGAIALLGVHGKPWAFDVLVEAFEKVPDKWQWQDLAGHLGAFGDPRAIPTMIAVIESDNDYESVYNVGHFGLRALTGVTYEEGHDGAWWRDWWKRNRSRFEQAKSLDVPHLNPVAR